MNKLLAIICLTFLVACASKATLSQKVAQAEAAFTSAVSIINDARRPCVLKSEDDPACLIKAELYVELAPIVHKGDGALDKAKAFAATNQLNEGETWLETAKRALTDINTYIDPIKAALGIGG